MTSGSRSLVLPKGSEPSLGPPVGCEHRSLTQGCAQKPVASVGSGVKLGASTRKLVVTGRVPALDLEMLL